LLRHLLRLLHLGGIRYRQRRGWLGRLALRENVGSRYKQEPGKSCKSHSGSDGER
jgi:hypothetical protein